MSEVENPVEVPVEQPVVEQDAHAEHEHQWDFLAAMASYAILPGKSQRPGVFG